MTKKQKKGLFLLLSGPALLALILVGYAISNFVVEAIFVDAVAVGNRVATETVGTFINIVLSLLGIVGILLVMIGIPVGIMMMVNGKEEGGKKKSGYGFHSLVEMANHLTIAMVITTIAVILLALAGSYSGVSALLTVVAAVGGISSFVLFLAWMYRAMANIVAKKKGEFWLSPEWGVGIHFIPLASSILPAFIWHHLWKTSIDKQTAYWTLVWFFGYVGLSLLVSVGSLFFGDGPMSAMEQLMMASPPFVMALYFGIGVYFIHKISRAQDAWK